MKPSEVFLEYRIDEMKIKPRRLFKKLYYEDCIVYYTRTRDYSFIIVKSGNFKYTAFRKFNMWGYHNVHQENVKTILSNINYYNKHQYRFLRYYENPNLIEEFNEWLLLESI